MKTFKNSNPGRVIWITGLSGAGKTTLGKALLSKLPQPCLLLDGDELREALRPIAGGYDYGSRRKLSQTYSRLCGLLARQGTTVVCATISMFHEVRAWNRRNLPGYIEIYLQASEELRNIRDYKRIYSLDKDTKKPVVGRSFTPELPENPDIVIDQDHQDGEEALGIILNYIFERER